MANSKADIEISIRLQTLKLNKELNDTRKRLNSSFSALDAKRFATIQTKIAANQKKINQLYAPQKFQSWALSIMFAGFAMQRLSMQLMTFGTKAYDEVSHSIIGTITANDRLQGSLMYLGYTFGQAMQPVFEALIPIIEMISTWVSENEGLVRTITTIALILGTLAGVGGALTLAINGFKAMFTAISSLASINMSSGLFGLTLASPWVLAIAAAAASMALFLVKVKENKELNKDFQEKVLGPLSESFGKVKNAITELITELGKTNGPLDLIGGMMFLIGGILVNGVAMAIMIIVDAITVLIKAWMTLYDVMTGDTSGAKKNLKDMANSAKDIVKSIGNAASFDIDLIKNVGENGITLSGQLGLNKPKATNNTTGPGQSSMAGDVFESKAYSTPQSQVVYNIQTCNINNPSSSMNKELGNAVRGYTN